MTQDGLDPRHVAALRSWAKGMYPLEAATELLLTAHGGRFAAPGRAWVKNDDGHPWVDFEVMAENAGGLSGGERRVLVIAASLAVGRPVDLSEAVTGLDRATLSLVLAALSHAGGTHEGAELVGDAEVGPSMRLVRRGALYPWPAATR